MLVRRIIPLPIRRLLGNTWDSCQRAGCKQFLKWSLRGDAVQCNVCEWRGKKLTDDPWHKESVCPECGSQVRHRLLAAALDGLSANPEISETNLLKDKAVLHFASERQFQRRIQKIAARYVTADYARGDTDWRLDISSMPSVKDGEFDTVICCDVLEHVSNDLQALQEIRRVLRPGGWAILTVPQKDSPATTDEDPTVTSEKDREQRFGQKDHVRIYGDDFVDRVTAAGFSVTSIDADSFSRDLQVRFVLVPPIPSTHPLATNHRIIYYCQA
jgi:SAM-dependent methyltransferase